MQKRTTPPESDDEKLTLGDGVKFVVGLLLMGQLFAIIAMVHFIDGFDMRLITPLIKSPFMYKLWLPPLISVSAFAYGAWLSIRVRRGKPNVPLPLDLFPTPYSPYAEHIREQRRRNQGIMAAILVGITLFAAGAMLIAVSLYYAYFRH